MVSRYGYPRYMLSPQSRAGTSVSPDGFWGCWVRFYYYHGVTEGCVSLRLGFWRYKAVKSAFPQHCFNLLRGFIYAVFHGRRTRRRIFQIGVRSSIHLVSQYWRMLTVENWHRYLSARSIVLPSSACALAHARPLANILIEFSQQSLIKIFVVWRCYGIPGGGATCKTPSTYFSTQQASASIPYQFQTGTVVCVTPWRSQLPMARIGDLSW